MHPLPYAARRALHLSQALFALCAMAGAPHCVALNETSTAEGAVAKATPARCLDLQSLRDGDGALSAIESEAIRLDSASRRLRPRAHPRSVANVRIDEVAHTGRAIFKVADDASLSVTLSGDRLTGGASGIAESINEAIFAHLGIVQLQPVFSRPSRALAFDRLCTQRLTGDEYADLSQFFIVAPTEVRNTESLNNLIARLNSMAFIEIAYAEAYAPRQTHSSAETVTKVDALQAEQGYLMPAPLGVDAYFAWGKPGGAGQYTRVVDVEVSWDFSHEDIPQPFVAIGSFDPAPANSNHGTAVLGIIGAQSNGLGVVGIANQSPIGVVASGLGATTIASAVDLASGL